MAERTKSGSSAIYLRFGVWMDKDGSIHMTNRDRQDFHVSVTSDPASRRGHPTLFRNLAKCLREEGVPAPSEPKPRWEFIMEYAVDSILNEAASKDMLAEIERQIESYKEHPELLQGSDDPQRTLMAYEDMAIKLRDLLGEKND